MEQNCHCLLHKIFLLSLAQTTKKKFYISNNELTQTKLTKINDKKIEDLTFKYINAEMHVGSPYDATFGTAHKKCDCKWTVQHNSALNISSLEEPCEFIISTYEA